jgi:hypothetical protein
VLNIIAELKQPTRAQIIDYLKGYGFLCLKYREQYFGRWPSDAGLYISEDLRFSIDNLYYARGGNLSSACDVIDDDTQDFEVCIFFRQLLPADDLGVHFF